jgi:hypothetical protein
MTVALAGVFEAAVLVVDAVAVFALGGAVGPAHPVSRPTRNKVDPNRNSAFRMQEQ